MEQSRTFSLFVSLDGVSGCGAASKSSSILNFLLSNSTFSIRSKAKVRFQPTLINLCKGDGLGMIDGVHQPDVFLELCISCHASFSIGQIYKCYFGFAELTLYSEMKRKFLLHFSRFLVTLPTSWRSYSNSA